MRDSLFPYYPSGISRGPNLFLVNREQMHMRMARAKVLVFVPRAHKSQLHKYLTRHLLSGSSLSKERNAGRKEANGVGCSLLLCVRIDLCLAHAGEKQIVVWEKKPITLSLFRLWLFPVKIRLCARCCFINSKRD